MPRRTIYLALLVGWAALTLVLTSIPDLEVDVPLPHSDKVAHFGFYGVMGFLCALWRRESRVSTGRSILSALAFVAFLGAFDEFHQNWVPGRSMDPVDWIADTLGGGSGAVASALLPPLFPFLLSR